MADFCKAVPDSDAAIFGDGFDADDGCLSSLDGERVPLASKPSALTSDSVFLPTSARSGSPSPSTVICFAIHFNYGVGLGVAQLDLHRAVIRRDVQDDAQ